MNKPHIDGELKHGIFEITVLVLSLLLLVALAVDSVYALPSEMSRVIQLLDTIVCVFLLADFFARFHHAKDKLAFLKWGWIDLLASIPNVEALRWGRLVRVLRILRLLRAIRSLHRILQLLLHNRFETGAVSLGLTAFLLVMFSSVAILITEQRADANIKTAEDAIWWSVTTITTVGYGDRYPITTEGRAIGIILMVSGVGMFGGLSGLMASMFLDSGKRTNGLSEDLSKRLDELQAAIAQISKQSPGS